MNSWPSSCSFAQDSEIHVARGHRGEYVREMRYDNTGRPTKCLGDGNPGWRGLEADGTPEEDRVAVMMILFELCSRVHPPSKTSAKLETSAPMLL